MAWHNMRKKRNTMFFAALQSQHLHLRVRELSFDQPSIHISEEGGNALYSRLVLKRSYLMFPRTLNVPPHGREKYMIMACIITHVVAQMKLYMLIACIFFEIASKSMHIEELAAASPPPTLLCAWFLMRFRENTCY